MRKERRTTKKIMAMLMVAVMMFSAVAVITGSDSQSDATTWTPNGTGNTYTYTLTYDSSEMTNTAAQELQLTVAGMTPISHAANTTTLSSLANEGSWGFDTTTGIGPFNSFYGAFDIDNGNAFVTVLNPYNLGQDLTGTALPSGNYNIMWVVPTVYWKVVDDDVTLTNDSTAGGTAYAHTIDGHVYNYIAIGVYHGSTTTIDNGSTTVLTSKSGVAPTASQTREVFRNQANNYTMDASLSTDATNHPAYSMLWNWYQWELYKLCSYTVMEGFNSQMIVGNGNVNGGNYTKVTGGADTLGPYAGNPGDLGSNGANATTYGKDYAKLFIEEAWGTVFDFVDGVVVNGNQGFYIDSSHEPTDSTTASGYVEYITQALPPSNFGATISTSNAKTWGFAETTNSSTDYYNKGMADKTITASTSGSKGFRVGGYSDTFVSNSVGCGLSFATAAASLTSSDDNIGSRLAFVFDADVNTYTATVQSNNSSYGTVSTGSITDIESGTAITISGNTITYGSGASAQTVTATPASASYKLLGWKTSNGFISESYTISADTTITAYFGTVDKYLFTLNYHENQMTNTATQELQLTVSGTTPISHASNTTSLSRMANYGSWTWDYNESNHTGTGIGPFNSFYGAFDINNGNRFMTKLNPYNLNQDLDGNTLDSNYAYNVMWVVPTVYWTTNPETGSVTLTDDPNAGGTAYAHTIDGKVYNYVAYGVYQGTVDDSTTPTKLTSESGKMPTVNNSKSGFRTLADNYAMDSSLGADSYSMLWNFNMWTLYKLIGYTVMEGFNSQSIVGNGHSYGGTYTFQTGALDDDGPYAGNPGAITDSASGTNYGSDQVKLFIEGAWGGINQFVDGVVFNNGRLGIDSNHIPTESTSGTNIISVVWSAISGYPDTIRTDAYIWGLGTNNSGSATVGITDYINFQSGAYLKIVYVGGSSTTAFEAAQSMGIARIDASAEYTSNSQTGSRLAFVFDNVPEPCTITFTKNESTWGILDETDVATVTGTQITVSGNTITVPGSPSVTITATPSTDMTGQYTYTFVNWTSGGSTLANGTVTVTGDMTITANFTQTLNTYTVSAAVDGTNSYGSLNKSSVASVPYGTTVTISGQTATVNLSPTADTITATETTDTVQYDYGWIGWTYQGSSAPASITVTGNVEITANFSRATQEYTVNYVSNNDNYGTISPASATTVPYGSAFVIDGRDITVDSQTSTATPHASTPSNSYSFTGYSVSNNAALNETTFPSLAIGQPVTVTGTFTEGPRVYTVTIVKNDNAWGTVSQSEIAVGYETTISANANVLTVGTTDITATETTDTDQYDYSFVDWTGVPSSGKVTDDITVTANFSQVVKQYTITWSIDGTDDTTQVAYGTVPTHADPVKANYTFTGWNPTPVAVTGTATYTAQFTPTVYTVTWNANGGTVDTATSTGSVESAVTVPTPTLDYNTFAGWYTEATGGTAITTPYYPTADITLYAHWTGIEYTVTFDATTNGGTTATASLTGTNSAGVTLPTATKEDMSFAGWYTEATGGTRVGFANDIYHPTADITLYAQYIEEVITTYSVNFNLDGGYGSITSLTYTGDVAEPHTFTIPDVSPSKYLLTFLGWATEIGQTSAQYVAGDTITVDPNASVTLYAVWGDTDDHDSFKSILNTIPLLMVIGLLLGVVGVFFNARKNGIDTKTVISVCIGAAIGIVVIAVLIAPLFASL